MNRIEINVTTGERKVIDLTPEEIAAAEKRTAAEAALMPLRNIESIEQGNPITHRALRELILTLGAVYPEAQLTVFYRRVKAVDDAICAERVKL